MVDYDYDLYDQISRRCFVKHKPVKTSRTEKSRGVKIHSKKPERFSENVFYYESRIEGVVISAERVADTCLKVQRTSCSSEELLLPMTRGIYWI